MAVLPSKVVTVVVFEAGNAVVAVGGGVSPGAPSSTADVKSKRFGEPVSTSSMALGVATLIRLSRTNAAVAVGSLPSSRAAAPDT